MPCHSQKEEEEENSFYPGPEGERTWPEEEIQQYMEYYDAKLRKVCQDDEHEKHFDFDMECDAYKENVALDIVQCCKEFRKGPVLAELLPIKTVGKRPFRDFAHFEHEVSRLAQAVAASGRRRENREYAQLSVDSVKEEVTKTVMEINPQLIVATANNADTEESYPQIVLFNGKEARMSYNGKNPSCQPKIRNELLRETQQFQNLASQLAEMEEEEGRTSVVTNRTRASIEDLRAVAQLVQKDANISYYDAHRHNKRLFARVALKEPRKFTL